MIDFKGENGERFARLGLWWTIVQLLGFASVAMSGCSISMSLPSFLGDDETGSIKSQRSPLSSDLDAADWRQARPALVKAMAAVDSQPPVAWSNPDSGHGGLFQSVGLEFARNGRKCRAFVAGVTAGETKSMLQGVGCLSDDGDIALDGVAAWKGL